MQLLRNLVFGLRDALINGGSRRADFRGRVSLGFRAPPASGKATAGVLGHAPLPVDWRNGGVEFEDLRPQLQYLIPLGSSFTADLPECSTPGDNAARRPNTLGLRPIAFRQALLDD
jgi:hypothetical protein